MARSVQSQSRRCHMNTPIPAMLTAGWVPLHEASTTMGVPRRTMTWRAQQGAIPARREGHMWYVSAAWVQSEITRLSAPPVV